MRARQLESRSHDKYKNEVGCRDNTVPKTVDTRRALRGGVRACNNLPQPSKTKM